MKPNTQVSERTLEETPARVIPFLRAVATNRSVRSAMMAAGYTLADQHQGWALLKTASGYSEPEPEMSDDETARAAIAAIDAWDEQAFRRIRAALDRLHPEQSAFVLAGITPSEGAEAMLSSALLLDRLDALQSAPERKGTRQADHAALATLEQRGIDKQERARLRRLLELARSVKEPVTPEVTPTAEERAVALAALRAWFVDWSETARAVIHRRHHLILMGLAQRRRNNTEADDLGSSAEPMALGLGS